MRYILGGLLILSGAVVQGQPDKKFSIRGSAGLSYEGYHLSYRPGSWTGISPRKPSNQVRVNFNPVFKLGNNFSLPVNFNFNTNPVAFAGPYAGLKNQSLGQWLINPSNNFGLNPQYKWAELLLGTQNLYYSELSTGDVAVFGAGIHLKPKNYVLQFFAGKSQRGVNYVPPSSGSPGVPGAYERNHWMLQLGTVKEGNYKILLNIARGEDRYATLSSPPPGIFPQEGGVVSIVLEKTFKKGWYVKTEGAQAAFTKDLYQLPVVNLSTSFKPLIYGRASTQKDRAVSASFGKKNDKIDVGYSTKYIGAGFQTTGYPYLSPDRWDNTINTRLRAWHNKMNIVANVGHRVNDMGNTSIRSNQLIANLNWFTQFSEKFSLNVNYNNFGFTAPSGFNPYGVKNISNDVGFTATYLKTGTKMLNLFTLNYNFSNYDERDVIFGFTTTNKTHTAVLTYVPTIFNSELTPDLSLMYFYNTMPLVKNRMATISTGISAPALKKKMQLKGQLNYTAGKLNSFTPNKNLTGSVNADYKVHPKLTWNIFLGSNYFKYGDEITPVGANYFEKNYRTGLRYQF